MMKTCPLCGSENIKTIVKSETFNILSCKTCTNGWTYPSPADTDYSQIDFHQQAIKSKNSESKIHDFEDLPVDWKKAIVKQLNMLKKHLPTNARILEIGCGDGIFLKQLQKMGYDVQGIEPGVSSSGRARENGLNVITDYFPSPSLEGTFDAVVLVQTFEHIENPSKLLCQISDIIPDGYLLLVQTNYESVLPRYQGQRWYGWGPDGHYWHFTPKGLRHICSKVGFEQVDLEYSYLVHGSVLLKTLFNLIPPLGDQFHILFKNGLRTTER